MENLTNFKIFGKNKNSILIAVKGGANCGKTTFMLKYLLGVIDLNVDLKKFPKKNPFSYEFLKFEDDINFNNEDNLKMKFQDIEVIERNKSDKFEDFLFIVFDINDEESWNDAKNLISAKEVDDECTILIGNKIDLAQNINATCKKVEQYLSEENLRISFYPLSMHNNRINTLLVNHFETLLKGNKIYKYRQQKLKIENFYKHYLKYTKEKNLTNFDKFCERFFFFLNLERNELREKFNENEKNNFSHETVKDDTLLTLLVLSIKGSFDNYDLTKNKCDICSGEIIFENFRILITDCLHCYCNDCMINLVRRVTKGSMSEKDYLIGIKQANCSKCAGDGFFTQVRVKDAYKCGELKLDNQEAYDKVAYDSGKTNIKSEGTFICILCKESQNVGEKYNSCSCCFQDFCGTCKEMIIKAEFHRAQSKRNNYKCPICNTEQGVELVGELFGIN